MNANCSFILRGDYNDCAHAGGGRGADGPWCESCATVYATARSSLGLARSKTAATVGRDGLVTVWDADGHYLGCMGIETWRGLLRQHDPEKDMLDVECAECGAEFAMPRVDLVAGVTQACPFCGRAVGLADVVNDG